MYEPIDKNVVSQIDVRKKVVSKELGRGEKPDLMYLTSNTGWVALSSGVNTITEDEEALLLKQEQRNNITGNPDLAKSRILLGGTTDLLGTFREGIFDALDPAQTPNAAYIYDITHSGYRPMSGITSLSVESKNTFGTLREAEVKIVAWTLSEFEKIEKLYLRPGFTMLLEWGHSVYLDNKDGSVGYVPKEGILRESFFSNTVDRSSIEAYIKQAREAYSQNYEAMIGYVKNFSWTYLPSGAYECTVRIISTGEILDSLKFAINPKTRGISDAGNTGVITYNPNFTTPQSAVDTLKKELKSPFHYFFAKLEYDLGTKEGAFKSTDLPSLSDFLKRLQNFTIYRVTGDYSTSIWTPDEEKSYFWVPLRVYLEIFNNYVTLVDTSKDTSNTDNYKVVKFNTDYTKSSKFLTIPEHFSIDPGTCVLEYEHNIPNDVVDKEHFGRISKIHNLFSTNAQNVTNGYDDVLNILVPTLYVENILDSALADDYENSKGATEIFQEILSGINTALGGINDLDLHYDEDSNTFFIVDRNNTPQDIPTTELELVGLNSIFTNISIESKLTNRTGTMIAVAAQGASQSYSDNLGNLLQWNKGVIDRIHRTKGTAETNKEGVEELNQTKIDDWKKWYEDVSSFFADFQEEGIGGGYTADQKESAKTLHSEYIKYYLYYDVTTNGKPSPSPIPVELSMQLEGISGLKIGNIFTIKKGLLPDYYNGRFGYIITGLSHTISPGKKWLTDIKSQFFPVGKRTKIGIPSSTSREEIPDSPLQAEQAKNKTPLTSKTDAQVIKDAKEFKNTPAFRGLQLRENTMLYKAGIGDDSSIDPVHATNSRHYKNRAIDIPTTGVKGDAVAKFWKDRGYGVLWRVKGHYTHVHVQW